MRLYPEEKEEIETFCKSVLNGKSPSDFAREALKNEMNRIKNNCNDSNSAESIEQNNLKEIRLEQIEGAISKLTSKIEELSMINTRMLDIQEAYPSQLNEIEGIDDKINAIKQVLKEHQKTQTYKTRGTRLKVDKISQKSKLFKEIVFDLLLNSKEFKSENGGWDLNE